MAPNVQAKLSFFFFLLPVVSSKNERAPCVVVEREEEFGLGQGPRLNRISHGLVPRKPFMDVVIAGTPVGSWLERGEI